MSNALSALTTRALSALDSAAIAGASPSTQADSPSLANPIEISLLAAGICVLAVWILRRAAHPAKLSLARTPGRHNSLHPGHIVLLLMLWLLAQGTVARIAGRFWPKESPQPLVLAAMASQVLWLVTVTLTAQLTFRLGLLRGFGLSLRHWVYDTGRGVMGYLAVLPVCALLAWLPALWLKPEQMPTHFMLLAMGKLSGWWQVAIIASAAVLVPLAEEMFFRGLLQSMLRRYFGRPWVAIVLTSTLFCLVHMPQWHTMGALFALSVVLGYNYERCGRLYPAILIHALFNAGNIVIWMTSSGQAG